MIQVLNTDTSEMESAKKAKYPCLLWHYLQSLRHVMSLGAH
jgi:hypothetical protein